MFTGSGIMALEAYSRGFKNINAVEFDLKTFSAATKHLQHLMRISN